MSNFNRRYVELIRKHFYEIIQRKTGWGSKEIKMAFETALADAGADLADEFAKQKETQV